MFLPRIAEKAAAKKQRTAAKMNAWVRAVMKGDAMVFGKKVCPVSVFRVAGDIPAVSAGGML